MSNSEGEKAIADAQEMLRRMVEAGFSARNRSTYVDLQKAAVRIGRSNEKARSAAPLAAERLGISKIREAVTSSAGRLVLWDAESPMAPDVSLLDRLPDVTNWLVVGALVAGPHPSMAAGYVLDDKAAIDLLKTIDHLTRRASPAVMPRRELRASHIEIESDPSGTAMISTSIDNLETRIGFKRNRKTQTPHKEFAKIDVPDESLMSRRVVDELVSRGVDQLINQPDKAFGLASLDVAGLRKELATMGVDQLSDQFHVSQEKRDRWQTHVGGMMDQELPPSGNFVADLATLS